MNAVFFDIDGTLFDTRADLAATVNHTRADLGLEPKPIDEVMAHVGLGARHLLAGAIPERADDVDRLWEIFSSHYADHMLESIEPYPGVRRTRPAVQFIHVERAVPDECFGNGPSEETVAADNENIDHIYKPFFIDS